MRLRQCMPTKRRRNRDQRGHGERERAELERAELVSAEACALALALETRCGAWL